MLNEIILSFPVVLFLLSIISILGPGLSTMMLALGLAEIPIFARMVRGAVLSIKQRDFVAAAIATGVPASRVMTRHLLPNIIAPIIVFTTIDLGFAILTTSALSYIGLGAQPPSPEWGAMLNQARRFVYDAWWLSVFPGLPILLAVVSINLLGDGLRDALDPKLR
jgi:peptide/nickel transport system permease protein